MRSQYFHQSSLIVFNFNFSSVHWARIQDTEFEFIIIIIIIIIIIYILIYLSIYLISLFTYLFIFLFLYLLTHSVFVSMTTEHKASHFLFNTLFTCVHSISINHHSLFLISFFHSSIGGEFKTLISSEMVYRYRSVAWVSRLR